MRLNRYKDCFCSRFVECGDQDSASSSLPASPMQHPFAPPSRHSRNLRDEEISQIINHGKCLRMGHG